MNEGSANKHVAAFKGAVADAALRYSEVCDGAPASDTLGGAATVLIGALWVFARASGLSREDFVETTTDIAEFLADTISSDEASVQ